MTSSGSVPVPLSARPCAGARRRPPADSRSRLSGPAGASKRIRPSARRRSRPFGPGSPRDVLQSARNGLRAGVHGQRERVARSRGPERRVGARQRACVRLPPRSLQIGRDIAAEDDIVQDRGHPARALRAAGSRTRSGATGAPADDRRLRTRAGRRSADRSSEMSIVPSTSPARRSPSEAVGAALRLRAMPARSSGRSTTPPPRAQNSATKPAAASQLAGIGSMTTAARRQPSSRKA